MARNKIVLVAWYPRCKKLAALMVVVSQLCDLSGTHRYHIVRVSIRGCVTLRVCRKSRLNCLVALRELEMAVALICVFC